MTQTIKKYKLRNLLISGLDRKNTQDKIFNPILDKFKLSLKISISFLLR